MSEELKKAYNRMSTEQLEELLRLDVLADDGLDDDTVFLILDILEEREKAAGEFVDDTKQMWDSFQKNYLPLVGSAPLYEENEVVGLAEETTEEQSDGSSPAVELTVSKKQKRNFRPALRAATLLVLGILFAAAVTATARAAGFDLFGIFARWTDESFGFSTTASSEPSATVIPLSDNYAGDYTSLREALEVHGITEQLSPTWLPDGYALDDISITLDTSETAFDAKYTTNSGELARVKVVSYNSSDAAFSAFEKDSDNVDVYVSNDIVHFVFSNLERTQVAWFTGCYECSISGSFSSIEAQQIVDSIYEG